MAQEALPGSTCKVTLQKVRCAPGSLQKDWNHETRPLQMHCRCTIRCSSCARVDEVEQQQDGYQRRQRKGRDGRDQRDGGTQHQQAPAEPMPLNMLFRWNRGAQWHACHAQCPSHLQAQKACRNDNRHYKVQRRSPERDSHGGEAHDVAVHICMVQSKAGFSPPLCTDIIMFHHSFRHSDVDYALDSPT